MAARLVAQVADKVEFGDAIVIGLQRPLGDNALLGMYAAADPIRTLVGEAIAPVAGVVEKKRRGIGAVFGGGSGYGTAEEVAAFQLKGCLVALQHFRLISGERHLVFRQAILGDKNVDVVISPTVFSCAIRESDADRIATERRIGRNLELAVEGSVFADFKNVAVDLVDARVAGSCEGRLYGLVGRRCIDDIVFAAYDAAKIDPLPRAVDRAIGTHIGQIVAVIVPIGSIGIPTPHALRPPGISDAEILSRVKHSG